MEVPDPLDPRPPVPAATWWVSISPTRSSQEELSTSESSEISMLSSMCEYMWAGPLPSMSSNSPISAGGSDTAPAGITAPSGAAPGAAAAEAASASSPSDSSSVPSSSVASSAPPSEYSSDGNSPSSSEVSSCSSASPVSSGASSLAAAGLEVASWPLPPSSPPQAAKPRVAKARADRNTTGLRVTMSNLSIQRQNPLSYGILPVGRSCGTRSQRTWVRWTSTSQIPAETAPMAAITPIHGPQPMVKKSSSN